MSTHKQNRSKQYQSDQRSQTDPSKSAGSREDQDRSRGSHMSQFCKPSENQQNDISTQKSWSPN
jgi:hypothetical protein